jgi:formate hydrogenlyase subunit 3/multisubunit Na+/H+ antiporter MnhD subunit
VIASEGYTSMSSWDLPAWAWLAVILLPALAACAVGLGRRSNALFRTVPWSAVPALLVALFGRQESGTAIPSLMLGMSLGLDEVSRVFLFSASALWWLSGLFATSYLLHDPRRSSFMVYFLLAMSGNIGLVLAEDAITFYLFFAVMSFASYGLVVHERSDTSLWAGRVYLLLVVVGEVLLFSGLALLAADSGSVRLDNIHAVVKPGRAASWASVLVFCGLGIKAGILPLHVWLPLAHPAAPTPASAVLSGAMIKAGLIGWLKLLPAADGLAMTSWGMLVIVLGVASAYYGVLVGLTQRNPKTVLAYSSISQMGLITVGVGVWFVDSDTHRIAGIAVAAYALHHAFAKGALFLGVSVYRSSAVPGARRLLCILGMVLAALAIAGFPLTSGALAKMLLKNAVSLIPGNVSGPLKTLLAIGAAGSTILMLHFLRVINRMQPEGDIQHTQHDSGGRGMWLPWTAVLSCLAVAAFLWPWKTSQGSLDLLFTSSVVWSGFWPVLLGALVFLVLSQLLARWWEPVSGRVPAGDILVICAKLVPLVRRSATFTHAVWRGTWQYASRAVNPARARFSTLPTLLVPGEDTLRYWPVGGGLMIGVFLATLALMLWRQA